MALSGTIKPGTVAELFRSIPRSKRHVTLLLHNEDQFGHAEFDQGELVSVMLDQSEGAEALELLAQWERGIYTILKQQDGGQATRATAVIIGHLDAVHSELQPWLKKHQFQTSIVPYAAQALEVVRFVQPDAIFLVCQPGATCHDLKARLLQLLDPPPIILVLGNGEGHCTIDGAPCKDANFSLAKVKHALATRWPMIMKGEAPPARIRKITTQTSRVAVAAVRTADERPKAAKGSDHAEGQRGAAGNSVESVGDTARVATIEPDNPRRRSMVPVLAFLSMGMVLAGVLAWLLMRGPAEEVRATPSGVAERASASDGVLSSPNATAATGSGVVGSASKPGTAAASADRQGAVPGETATGTATDERAAAGGSTGTEAEGRASRDSAEAAPPAAEPSGSAASGGQRAVASAPRKTRTPRRSKPRRKRSGTLTVTSNVAAMVAVDGIARGRVPANLTLHPGTHVIKVTPIGQPDSAQGQSIRIEPGKTATAQFSFSKAPATPPKPKRKPPKKRDTEWNDTLPTDNLNPWTR
jgi:hypothetical protein